MAIDNPTKQTAQALTDDAEKVVIVTDAQVRSDGRITIPDSTRERHGIEDGDYADIILVMDDE